jgi:hypothetical protein
MNTPVIIRGTLLLRRRANVPEPDATLIAPTTKICRRRIPRIARLMALARHVEELVCSGTVGSYAAAARLGRVSRARMSQILGLLNLAPDIQEQLLFLECPDRGRPTPVLPQVLTVATALDWGEQRRRWRRLRRAVKQWRAAMP